MEKAMFSKHIVTELKTPDLDPQLSAEYAKWATRILWMDDTVVEGAFHFNCAWYLKPPPEPLDAHTHEYGEIIGFFGSNPQDPYELGGEVEFWIENEKHLLKKSCLIFIPKGVKHCPMVIRRVDTPILHLGSAVK